jgi:hypothetical protein
VVFARRTRYLAIMNRFEPGLPHAKEARLRFLDGDYQIVVQGEYVRCAVSGRPIRLEELKYWSVARQEAYASAEMALKRHLQVMEDATR